MLIERITNTIVNAIDDELKLDKDNRAVIYYGTFALIQMLLSICIVLVLGIVIGVPEYAITLSVVTSSLRQYSGGAHAENSRNCIILGTIFCLIQAILIGSYTPYASRNQLIYIGVMVFIISFYLLYKLAPVDSINKPIKKEDKKRKLKRSSLIILSMYFVLTLVLLWINNIYFFSYVACIYMGITWQVFTITKVGHVILSRLDALFDHILS